MHNLRHALIKGLATYSPGFGRQVKVFLLQKMCETFSCTLEKADAVSLSFPINILFTYIPDISLPSNRKLWQIMQLSAGLGSAYMARRKQAGRLTQTMRQAMHYKLDSQSQTRLLMYLQQQRNHL
ncbi:MAG: hypothetical protein ACYS8Y_11875, partial [Planctomycetota bacterium]